MDTRKTIDEFFEDDAKEQKKFIKKLNNCDNNLMNIWIKCYFDRYWVEKKNLHPNFISDILGDCEKYYEYFNWVDANKPILRKDRILKNEECVVLYCILENCSGIEGFSLWDLLNVKKSKVEKYNKSIIETSKFP